MTPQPAEWSKPPHRVYVSSIPEPVCPGCGHDEHNGTCPVRRRKLKPCHLRTEDAIMMRVLCALRHLWCLSEIRGGRHDSFVTERCNRPGCSATRTFSRSNAGLRPL